MIQVLLVEDDPADVLIARQALAGAETNLLYVAADGVIAVNFLRKRGEFAAVATPDLILLDLNLPRKDGRQVLAEVKADPELRQIPVVVLTVSQAQEDVLRSYELHANAYVSKPVDADQFVAVIREIGEFFADVARLPGR